MGTDQIEIRINFAVVTTSRAQFVRQMPGQRNGRLK